MLIENATVVVERNDPIDQSSSIVYTGRANVQPARIPRLQHGWPVGPDSVPSEAQQYSIYMDLNQTVVAGFFPQPNDVIIVTPLSGLAASTQGIGGRYVPSAEPSAHDAPFLPQLAYIEVICIKTLQA
jgi:hypothetical protein